MKKNRLLKTLIIASFITYSLVSCSNNGNSVSSSNVETTTMDIDSINRIVFEEFKKSFPDATYDDFLLNSKKQESSVDITYKYLSSSIIVGLNGNFKSKDILITNDLGVNEKRTVYYYIKSNWVVVEDYIYVDDREKSWAMFIQDIKNSKSSIYIDLPDVIYDDTDKINELANVLDEMEERGLIINIRLPEDIDIPIKLQKYVQTNDYVTNPVTIIDKEIVWFGQPLYAADFITEGDILETEYFPCIRFVGNYTARSLQAFLEIKSRGEKH